MSDKAASSPRLRLRVLAAALTISTCAAAWPDEPLRFSVEEGAARNEFFRSGPIAAHLVLRSGTKPRLIVAFPAGNSGAAVWFDAEGESFAWKPGVAIRPASLA